MDLQFTDHEPTDAERAAVDSTLVAMGMVVESAQQQVAYGGVQAAEGRRNLLLPILNGVQSEIGWVSHGAINYIGRRLSVSPAEAFGVAQFYELISTEPRPERVAHVCDDIACRAAGVEAMVTELENRLGPAGEFEGADAWVRSPCLGQCDRGSAAFIQVAGGEDLTLAPTTAAEIGEALAGHAPPSSDRPTPIRRHPALQSSRALQRQEAGDDPEALRTALRLSPDQIVDEVVASGLRGRGGAAFPAGIKWRAVAAAEGPKYVVCNADESEPGTFKDRALMEADPSGLVEAIAIAGYAIGATRGFIYIRGEYPLALERLEAAISQMRNSGNLGENIAGSDFSFDIEIRKGAGAYVCGEETALFNSIEGFRGEPRQKPPFPTQAGLFGRPTLVNNVETLMTIPAIVLDGGAGFAAVGSEQSTGSKLFCVSGNVAEPGVYEAPFGVTTNELIDMAGGAEGDIAAVLVGGAAGTFMTQGQLDIPLTFEDTAAQGVSLGSGVVMVFNDQVDMAAVLLRIAHFFSEESCGLCVPCRVGTVRQEEALERLAAGAPADRELELLDRIDSTLRDASICGLGQMAGNAIRTAATIGLIGGER